MRCILVLLALTLAASGRVGWTPAELQKRFGEPFWVYRTKDGTIVKECYRKGDIRLEAVFVNGRCVHEFYETVSEEQSATIRELHAQEWEMNVEADTGNKLFRTTNFRALYSPRDKTLSVTDVNVDWKAIEAKVAKLEAEEKARAEAENRKNAGRLTTSPSK